MQHLAAHRLPATHNLDAVDAIQKNIELLKQQSMHGEQESTGAVTLSPPHTWTESGEEESTDDRHLFTVTVSLPDGKVLNSRITSDLVDQQDLQIGETFLRLLVGNGQSFFLSASITSNRQRIFSRIKCGRMTKACELFCEFDHHQKSARVSALCLRSAFGPSTPFVPIAFTTKHSSNCALTHIDYTSVPYLGHLPTDVIGRSILSFVHAPDVHIIRQAHIDLHNNKGRVTKSVGPIRFVAYNGALLTTETEWSAYVNPWSRKMEMVVARHRILDAPVGDADVLSAPSSGVQPHLLPLPLAKTFEDELRSIMARPVPSSRDRAAAAAASNAMCTASPHPADLGAYIDRLVETLVVNGGNMAPNPIKFASSSSAPPVDDVTLSYSQINCLENVHRLLKSLTQLPVDEKTQPVVDDLREMAPSMKLTQEALQEHTRLWEEEYKHTWRRRLNRKRSSCGTSERDATTPKMSRSANNTPTQCKPQNKKTTKDDYYRLFAPNPSLPTGSNYQIITVPLPPKPTEQPRVSAFSSVPQRSREVSAPLALSISDPPISVIQPTHSDGLVVPVHPCSSRLICMAQRRFSTPPPPQPPAECLMLADA